MKRFITAFVSFVLVASLVFSVGCSGNEGETTPEEKVGEGQVLDGSGVVHDIPDNPQDERIASVYGIATPFLVALELEDQIVAINTKTKFWREAEPKLTDMPSVGQGRVDLEALASLDPTVLVHRSNDADTTEAVQEKLNIPVFGISAEDRQEVYDTLDALGAYFGKGDRAAEVTGFMKEKFGVVDQLVQDIDPDEYPTALVFGGEIGSVHGGDMLQSGLLEQAGGINLAKEVENDKRSTLVGTEQIFEWNPEYIFITAGSALEYRTDTLLEDPAWSEVEAVKQGHVYQIPAKIDGWDIPGVAAPIASLYMVHCMHPEVLSAEELQGHIDDYYEFMFGRTFDPEYLGYELED